MLRNYPINKIKNESKIIYWKFNSHETRIERIFSHKCKSIIFLNWKFIRKIKLNKFTSGYSVWKQEKFKEKLKVSINISIS